jgi:hypothetical protein
MRRCKVASAGDVPNVMTKLVLAAIVVTLVACTQTQAPDPAAPVTPASSAAPSTTPAESTRHVCSLDDPKSCPAGQTCHVPPMLPTRNGECR